MKAGDLVKYRDKRDHEARDQSLGVIIEIKILPLKEPQYGVLWGFMPGQLGWQYRREIEVVNEGR